MDISEFLLLKGGIEETSYILINLALMASLVGSASGVLYIFRKGDLQKKITIFGIIATAVLLTLLYIFLIQYHLKMGSVEFINIFQGGTFHLAVPFWIENERLLFWIWTYALMAIWANFRFRLPLLNSALSVILLIYMAIFVITDPYDPLPELGALYGNYLSIIGSHTAMQNQQQVLIMYNTLQSLIGKYYFYNTSYMWTHPPMVFIAYSAFTINFAACILMLVKNEKIYDKAAYSFGKFGYFILTISMLLGYPWALKAWEGSSWWWSPIISASFMLWFMYTGYLHTRIYITDRKMWWLSGILGILGFVMVVFAYILLFVIPGIHSYA